MDLTIKALPVPTDYNNKRPIDPRLPQHRFRMLICSPSYSGKSNLILTLIKEKRFYWDYFKVFIFSKSYYQDPIFDNISILSKYTCDDLSERKIQKILDHQQYLKEKYEEEGKPEKLPNILLIIDDCAGDAKLSNRTSMINKLMFRGRHANMSILITTQSYKMLSKNIRTNMSDLIFYGADNDKELRAIAEENSGGLTVKKFENLFKKATEKRFNFLYISRKHKGKLRFRKNFDTSIWYEGNEIKQEPLVMEYPKIKKKQPKIKPAVINFKRIPPRKNKKKPTQYERCFGPVYISDEESSSESSSDYDEFY
jgi:hypothetical protein